MVTSMIHTWAVYEWALHIAHSRPAGREATGDTWAEGVGRSQPKVSKGPHSSIQCHEEVPE